MRQRVRTCQAYSTELSGEAIKRHGMVRASYNERQKIILEDIIGLGI